MKENEYGIIRRLKISYVVALSAIALFTATSCAILVREIYNQQSSSRVINISGRQRMLSQNIVKNLLLLNGNYPAAVQANSREELSGNYKSWIKAHDALLHGDASLDIPERHLSPAINSYFNEIIPYYNSISELCRTVLANNDHVAIPEDKIEMLLSDEQHFLALMDKITFRFDDEAKAGTSTLIRYELIFLLLTFLTLVLEAFLIFRPMIKMVHKNILDYNALFEEKKKQELESLSAIVEAQENEKHRIANELHDGIAQMLSLVKINLSAIESDHEQNRRTIQSAQSLLDQITVELKNVSYNLMPSSLSQFGLIPALEELEDRMQFNNRTSFRFEKRIAATGFDPKTDVIIYRIIQELINNTLKHSGATDILLQIAEREGVLVIVFKNNGASFDPHLEQTHETKGLKNIHSHVRNVNGSIDFDTMEQGEIIITLEIPVNKAE